MQIDYDTIVIGCGAAALAFCSKVPADACAKKPKKTEDWLAKEEEEEEEEEEKEKSKDGSVRKILVIERGKPYENRGQTVPSDLAQGEAGVGPYIDGKLSGFPAGTNMYKAQEEHLSLAYEHMLRDISPFLDADNQLEEMPARQVRDRIGTDTHQNHRWKLKRYRAVYMQIDKRFAWIKSMLNACRQNATILTETIVISVDQSQNDSWSVCVRLKDGSRCVIRANRLILAGGRFLPAEKWCAALCRKFRRTEFGVRVCFNARQMENDAKIETAQNTDLKQGSVDPKWIFGHRDGSVEWRTFCFCERGKVLETKVGRWNTLSGRADCEPTDETNFGFMCRIKDLHAAQSSSPLNDMKKCSPFAIAVGPGTFLSDKLQPYFGKEASTLLSSGLSTFFDKFPFLLENKCVLRGPCVEGVGFYPDVDCDMRVRGYANLYAIGDCNGTFRGLVPSLLSGYFLRNKLSF